MARPRKLEEQKDAQWDFFSFTGFFAFSVGMLFSLIMVLLLGYYMFIIAVFCTSFGVFHMISYWTRRRIVDRAKQRADEAERERRALEARAREGEGPSRRRRRRR
jgi:membrane protein implicated in regulation of membrane protease activity